MRFVFSVCVLLSVAASANASVRRYADNYPGFIADAGPANSCSFNTLPDGNPSIAGTPITAVYNYDALGAHFSASNGTLRILGSVTTEFDLVAQAPDIFQMTTLLAVLSSPAHAVGAFFPGGQTMIAYDALNVVLGSVTAGGGGPGHFTGIVSDTPIVRVEFTRSSNIAGISSFLFTPIPEPATLGLALFGAILLQKRHR